MIQYSIQCNDCRFGWRFLSNRDYYEAKERAQDAIDAYVNMWKRRKDNHSFLAIDKEHLAKPENWRIVQRLVTDWTPVK